MADSTWSRGLDSLAEGLAGIFKDKSASAWRKELSDARRSGNRYKQIGRRTVDYGELTEIENLPIFRLGQFEGGLIVIKDSERNHPYGTLANRTIGSVNAVGEGTGIEYTYDYRLRGEKGEQTVHRALGGE